MLINRVTRPSAIYMTIISNQVHIIQPDNNLQWSFSQEEEEGDEVVSDHDWSSIGEKISESRNQTEKKSLTWVLASAASISVVFITTVIIMGLCIKKYRRDHDVALNLREDVAMAVRGMLAKNEGH